MLSCASSALRRSESDRCQTLKTETLKEVLSWQQHCIVAPIAPVLFFSASFFFASSSCVKMQFNFDFYGHVHFRTSPSAFFCKKTSRWKKKKKKKSCCEKKVRKTAIRHSEPFPSSRRYCAALQATLSLVALSSCRKVSSLLLLRAACAPATTCSCS
jgi:hypothetical protein